MHPSIRSQADYLDEQDRYSLEAAIDTTDLPDTARQEFKREADVNYILSRHGVDGIPQRQVSYGENDFNLDLHGAYIAHDAAEKAWYHLPAKLQDKYPSVKAMLDAMNSGALGVDLAAEKDLNEKIRNTPPVPKVDPEPST